MGRGARGRAGWNAKPETLEKTLRGRMMLTAFKRKRSTRGNHSITIEEGDIEPNETFAGPKHVLNGTIVFRYHGTCILGIDFVNKRITNFGNAGYSISTDQNIASWEGFVRVALRYQFPDEVRFYQGWLPHISHRYKPDDTSVAVVETMHNRFMARCPWVVRDWQDKWFHWNLFDEKMAKQHGESAAFLHTEQNWRYFTYDWDADGNWTRKFIDADAEKRWKMREAKRLRARERKLDGHVQAGV